MTLCWADGGEWRGVLVRLVVQELAYGWLKREGADSGASIHIELAGQGG